MMQAAIQLKSLLLDVFVLQKAESTIRNYSPEQHAQIRQLTAAAMQRIELADDTTDPGFASATIPLYCDAIRALISAIVISKEAIADFAVLEFGPAIQKLQELIDSNILSVETKNFDDEAMSTLKLLDPLNLDKVTENTAAEQRAVVEKVAHWLRTQVEARTKTHLLILRIARIATATAAIVTLFAWALTALLAPKNIALNKPVKMSSQYPGTPDPSGATDGKIVGPFQAHTSIETDPWISVDLGSVRAIKGVSIYNRTDGLYTDALPLSLELSDDGFSFRQVDQRKEVFTGSAPWIFKTHNESARIVRIHGHPASYVVVTEIEVFGN